MGKPEVILCDTSLVGVIDRSAGDPTRIAHWPPRDRDRLDRAVLAISVVTEAEVRAGWTYASWGERRVADAELRLRAYVSVPVDRATLDEWSRLSAANKSGGWNISDNDLWIAATAIAHGLPLATSDGDHHRIAEQSLELLFYPVAPRE